MKVLRVRNVHQALPEALRQLQAEGVERDSRNGPVLMFPEPTTTVYERPTERVVFWPSRDANPFFHLIESLWMLAGRNDVEFVARYVERMRSFSDDGVTFHGAYGFRWRHWFGFDQLVSIADALKKDPTDRRQVLSMWDATQDLGRSGKDLPCNLQALFAVTHEGRLDMTVTNRSNDLIWGAYGANAVHFSYLHEYMAAAVGVPVGVYRQVSNNLHAYKAVMEQVVDLATVAPDVIVAGDHWWAGLDPYVDGTAAPFPLVSTDLNTWNGDLEMFMSDPLAVGFRDPFFRKVVVPMIQAHEAYKHGEGLDRYDASRAYLNLVKASDWRLAALEWIERRRAKFLRANDDGAQA